MDTPSLVFESNGWCAVMEEQFTDTNVVRIAHALGRYLSVHRENARPAVAVGYDGRSTSDRCAGLVADVLSSYGIRVFIAASIVPTAALAFAIKDSECCAGVMITAGGQPPAFNGITLYSADGGALAPAAMLQMQQTLHADAEPYAAHPEHIASMDMLAGYRAQLRSLVDIELLRTFGEDPRSHAGVIIDSMGGAGQTIIEEILSPCGWRAQTIFGTADAAFYDRIPASVPLHLEPLRYNVRVTDTRFGIATNGDAGRCGIVFDDGAWMEDADIHRVLGGHIRDHKSWQGGETVRGEGEGGFAFPRHLPVPDGILTGLLIAEAIARDKRSLRDIAVARRMEPGRAPQ